MINIAVRADSSTTMGTGHIMRCLTLVNAICAKLNAKVYFFCRQTEGNINKVIEAAGHQVIVMAKVTTNSSYHLNHSHWLGATIEQDADEFLSLSHQLTTANTLSNNNTIKFDYLIVDHYGIDIGWHQKIKTIVSKIIVIDDLADRHFDCDYIIDQTFNCLADKYQQLVPDYCEPLLGTKYAMLRPEFNISLSPEEIIALRTNREIGKLLVMFGGTDPDNLTLKTLEKLAKIKHSEKNIFQQVDIILGSSAKYKNNVQRFCQHHTEFNLHIAPANIAKLMLNADIAIGAAGTTSWERCALGLPSIVMILADNQRTIAKALNDAKCSLSFNISELESVLIKELPALMNNPNTVTQMIKKSLAVSDALGCQRIISKVFFNV